MSDIGIRFDGLFLLAALAVGAFFYLLIASLSALRAWLRPATAQASLRTAQSAGLMGAGATGLLAGFFAYWAGTGTSHSGIDWLDLLTIPWTLLFLGGCWHLVRIHQRA